MKTDAEKIVSSDKFVKHLLGDTQMPDELKDYVIECINGLDNRRYRVLVERYVNGMTLQATGELFDLSRERIRQLQARGLSRLRNQYARKRLEAIT